MQRLGLLQHLAEDEGWRIYDAVGREAPLSAFLRLYYAADGDAVESLWRRQSDGFAEAHRGQLPADVAEGLLHAMPEAGPLKIRLTREALVVSNERHTVSVSQVVRHSRVRSRTHRVAQSRPRHVVQAVNALLSYDDQPRRFIEMTSEHGRYVFIAADAEAARKLLDLKATTHQDISALYSFTLWDRSPSIAAVG